MKMPEYITAAEVKRVCRELKLRDWSRGTSDSVSVKEARTILRVVNTQKMPIPIEVFRRGLEVELEHGTRFGDANVTNNHPVLTGMIVLAHLKEMMDYYERLDIAELEGDLFKAVQSGNLAKIRKYYRQLTGAKQGLYRLETKILR